MNPKFWSYYEAALDAIYGIAWILILVWAGAALYGGIEESEKAMEVSKVLFYIVMTLAAIGVFDSIAKGIAKLVRKVKRG